MPYAMAPYLTRAAHVTLLTHMSTDPRDICPRPDHGQSRRDFPLVPPLELAAVYCMDNPDQAERMLGGLDGFVYARDRHPNGIQLAEKCRRLHGAERGVVCASGMSALAAVALALTRQGDEVVVSDQLYGKSIQLLSGELARWGVASRLVDSSDLSAVEALLAGRPRLLVVETISNPLLRVADLTQLARLAHAKGALLLVDNTFASPVLCRPLEWGADLVMESLTKIINGHSDVILGFVGGREEVWERFPTVISTWGLGGSPFDCWLAFRGLGTLAVRIERASANALEAARFLDGHTVVTRTWYPGLESHPDHALATKYLSSGFGAMVTFTLSGGRDAATRFIHAVSEDIPFAPSLGDLSTTLSHPESTSHRGLSPAERARLGIDGGTIRLSVGIESAQSILAALERGLWTVQTACGLSQR